MGVLSKPKAPALQQTLAPPSLNGAAATPDVLQSNLNTPQFTDPGALTGLQSGLNWGLTQGLYGLNAANQVNPYGSLNYTQDPSTGQYTATQNLSPQQQQLLDYLQGTQATAGSQAGGLLSSANYQNPANLGDMASGLTKQQLDAYTNYNQPYYQKSQDALDNQLRNQGLVPGDRSYDFQMKQIRDNQGTQQSNAAAQFEPQAFSQAVQQYQMPAQMAQSLAQFATPGSITQNLTNTPQAQGYQTDALGAYNSYNQANLGAYGAQNQAINNYNSVLSTLFGTQQGGVNALNSALMSGYGTQQGGVSALNQARMEQYDQQMQNYGGLLKGIGGIGAAALLGPLGGPMMSGLGGMLGGAGGALYGGLTGAGSMGAAG